MVIDPKEDYFAVEPLLVARVKQLLPELRDVVTAESFSAATDWRKAAPVAHVVYVGDELPQGAAAQGSGGVQVTVQQWMVVLAIKHAGTVQSGEGARRVAGPLIARLLKGLVGWAPAPVLTPLRRAPAPKAGYLDGIGFYPFTFRTSHLLLGKT